MLSSERPTEGPGHHGGRDSVHLGHHQGVVSAVTHHRLGEHHVLKVQSDKRKLFNLKYLKVVDSKNLYWQTLLSHFLMVYIHIPMGVAEG